MKKKLSKKNIKKTYINEFIERYKNVTLKY